MKKKLLLLSMCFLTLICSSGCSDYSSIRSELDQVTIQNTLPEVPSRKAKSIKDVEDDVYDQQIAICEMLTDSYEKTYYQNFTSNNKGSSRKISEICNDKRMSINKDIQERFYRNIFDLISDADDCLNPKAYVEKAYDNVLTFYDAYNKYMTDDNKDVNLTNILLNYNERRNVLAHSFLARHEKEVFKAAVAVIEGNAAADDEFRFYVNKNNLIINALNDEFGGVPKEYAERITAASTKLAINLVNSLSSLTDKERKELLDDLAVTSPSPSPTITPTPTPRPTLTPAPVMTPRPVVTRVPSTPRPVATVRPVSTPRPPEPTEAPQPEEEVIVQEPEPTEVPQPEEELPEYSFD